MTATPSLLESRSPLSGELVGSFAISDDEDVHRAVDQARIAARWWADRDWSGRRARLLKVAAHLSRRADELADVVHREMGKPRDDARLEIALSLEHLRWAALNAESVLKRTRVRRGLLALHQRAHLSYEPLGVVGVIGPWNYPVFTPMGSLAYALAAGNSVVFKPSEWASATGNWLVHAFNEVIPDQPVVQAVFGGGAVGASLCGSGVDLMSFTGSPATGRRVMAACATTLTPVILECGGKDAALVDADADITRAADAIVFGAFSNAGQTCVGVERVYAHREIYDELLAAVTSRVATLEVGTHGGAHYGPLTLPHQAKIVRSHIEDALERGGTAAHGGVDSIDDRIVHPVVLTDVPEDSSALQEETFGPLIVINPVRDLDEAVDRANATGYGLAASIFGRDSRRLRHAASRLRVGMVSINSWVMYAGVPGLPWGGVGESGMGRIHGADGLRGFTRPHAIVEQGFALPVSPVSFQRPRWLGPVLMTGMKIRHGGWRRS
jgi:succinate-semialdehyde dehydrogenase / glutarate-semialdehyde dehydrogenase